MTSFQTTFQTIETTATVDENGVLKAALVGVAAGEVRVFVMVAAPQTKEEDYTLEAIDEKTWHQGIVSNPVFDFLKDPAEDIYTLEDGEPLPPLRKEGSP